jgi:integrase
MQSEVLTLTLSQVDFSASTLRINPGGSKTGESRVVYPSAEVRMLVEEQLERVRTLLLSPLSICKTQRARWLAGTFSGTVPPPRLTLSP